MVVWLLVLSPLIFFVARWAWRYQLRLLSLTGAGLNVVAGRPGAVADVQLISVLIDGPLVLIRFQPAATKGPATSRRWGRSRRDGRDLLVSLERDAEVSIAAPREWEASGVPVVMWRDGSGSRLELSLVRNGQQVAMSVVAHETATRAELH